MPSYAEELERSQRGAVRAACVLAAGILLAFSLLDRALVPKEFLPLLDLKTEIVPAAHRNNAGILGAAALAVRTDR